MLHHYEDIRRRIDEAPKWWDEHGVPRYDEFKPGDVADIYARQCALVWISCQQCGELFEVAFSWSLVRGLFDKSDSLYDCIMKKTVHYGDPPNVGCCSAGATMNCNDLEVLEYWERASVEDGLAWVRRQSVEGRLDDQERGR